MTPPQMTSPVGALYIVSTYNAAGECLRVETLHLLLVVMQFGGNIGQRQRVWGEYCSTELQSNSPERPHHSHWALAITHSQPSQTASLSMAQVLPNTDEDSPLLSTLIRGLNRP